MQLYQEALSCAQEVHVQQLRQFIVQRCFASFASFASKGTNDLPGIGRSKWPEPQRSHDPNTIETDAILAIPPNKKPKS